MLLNSLLSKFQKQKIYKEKIYKEKIYGDSLSTLIPFEDWYTTDEIEYEISEKDLASMNYLIIKRKSGNSTKILKFKSKGYNHSYLTTESKDKLVSIIESKSTNKLIQWNIKLEDNSYWEKSKYQNIKLSTKDGKHYEIEYKYQGQIKILLLNASDMSKSWNLISKDNHQILLSLEFSSLKLKEITKFKLINNLISLPEPILLVIFGHIISQKQHIIKSLSLSSLNISF